LTDASTPSSLFSFFSMRIAHDAQVMPLISSTTWRVSSEVAMSTRPERVLFVDGFGGGRVGSDQLPQEQPAEEHDDQRGGERGEPQRRGHVETS
jgi:hypothetical protein